MNLVVMVEEPSMKKLLEIILPKIIPPGVDWHVYGHEGKGALRRSIPLMTQIEGAGRIAPYMNIESNTSRSFQVFVEGVRRLCQV